jgi:uncharacterized protein YhaN
MKIIAMHVEGFGVWRDQTFQLQQPVTVFYGSNEVGKSTLIGFIRAILFGFANRSNLVDRYEPLRGGTHGGSLTLLNDDGQQILVERFINPSSAKRSSAGNVKVTLPDGSVGGEERLQKLLGGLSADLFRNLFAFGLTELQEMRTLQSTELSSYLYSTGLGIRGTTIIEAEKKLHILSDQLYKPRGKNQDINVTLKSLEDVERNLRRSKERSTEYELAIEHKRNIEIQIQEIEINKNKLREQSTLMQQAFKARESWLRFKQVDELWNATSAQSDISEDVKERLDAILLDIERVTEQKEKQQFELQQKQDQRRQITIDERVLQSQNQLERLLDQLSGYEEQKRICVELQGELDQIHIDLDKNASQLDHLWPLDRLRTFPLSITMREQIQQFKRQFDDVQQTMTSQSAEFDSLQKQLKRFQDQADQQKEVFQRSQLESQHLVASWGNQQFETELDPRRSIQKISREYEQWKRLHLESTNMKQRIEDLQRNAQWQAMVGVPNQQVTGSRSTRFLIVLTVAFAAVVMWFAWQKDWTNAGLFGLIGILLIIGYLITTRRSHTTKDVPSNDNRHLMPIGNRSNHTIDSEIREAFTQFDGKEKRKREFEQQVTQLVQPFITNQLIASHITPQHRWTWVEVQHWLDTSLEDAIRDADRWQEKHTDVQLKRQTLDETQLTIYSLNQQLQELKENIDQSHKNKDAIEKSWMAWLNTFGFQEQLSPEGATQSMQLIEQIQHTLRQQDRQANKKSIATAQIENFQQEVTRLLHLEPQEDIHFALKNWKVQAQEQLSLQQKIVQLDEQIHLAQDEIIFILEREGHAQAKLAQLCEEHHVQSADELRNKYQQYISRKTLEEEKRQLLQYIELIVGTHQIPQLEQWVSQLGEEAWRQQVEQLVQQVNDTEQKENQLRETWGRLSSELDSLEQGVEHAMQLQHSEQLKSELNHQVEKYMTVSLAQSLIRRAKEQYEKERQPAVLQRASGYFQQMTNRKYSQILAPLDEQKLVAMNQHGQATDATHLSRGAKEQLYLAMRFSIAEAFHGRANLPLVLDDILVNFDKTRMIDSLQVLQQLSQTNQVLFFTCHAHMVTHFAQHIPDAQIIEL